MTLEKFAQALRTSELLRSAEIKKLVAEYAAKTGTSAAEIPVKDFARHLIAEKAITEWQAKKLLKGTTRGFVVGRYKLLSLIGVGGMGSVFLAEHTMMHHRVAIKVLPQSKFLRSSYLDRFIREARAAAALDHVNIVRAYDIELTKVRGVEMNYIVMEYIDGANMMEIVKSRGPMSPIEAVHYLRQAAAGLAHAHDAGLIHRDVKPENLLIDRQGTVKLLDLGLARFSAEEDHSLTVEHNDKVIGTADYLAPEQAVDSHTVDHRADIYGLGCTLFYILTGQPPFNEGSMAQRLIAHQTKEPPKLKEFRKDVPKSLEQLMLRLMAKDPAERPQTAEEVSELFAAWISENVGTSVSGVIAPPTISGVMPSGSSAGSSTLNSRIKSAFSGAAAAASTSNAQVHTKASEMLLRRPGLSTAILGGGACLLVLMGVLAGSVFNSDEPVEATASSTPQDVVNEDAVGAVAAPLNNLRVDKQQLQVEKQQVDSPQVQAQSANTNPDAVVPAGAASVAGNEKLVAKAPPTSMPKNKVPQTKLPSQPRPSATTVVKSNDVVWDSPTKPAVAKVIAVGANGRFASITEALNHVANTFTPSSESDQLTIKLGAGEVFRESLMIGTGKAGAFPENVTIESDEDNPATVIGIGRKPALTVKFVDGLTVRNVIFDGNQHTSTISLVGYVRGMLLENLKVVGFQDVGISGDSASGAFQRGLRFANLEIRGTSKDQVGIQLIAEKRPANDTTIENCRLIGPLADGIEVQGEVKALFVRHTIFDDMNHGIHFSGEKILFTRFQAIGNTFHRLTNAFLLDQNPEPDSAKLAIAKNLFCNSEAELRVAGGTDAATFDNLFTDGGWFGGNFAMRRNPQSPAKDEYTVVQKGGYQFDNPQFVSTKPEDPDYLRPRLERLTNAPLGDPPHYVGAIPGKAN